MPDCYLYGRFIKMIEPRVFIQISLAYETNSAYFTNELFVENRVFVFCFGFHCVDENKLALVMTFKRTYAEIIQ